MKSRFSKSMRLVSLVLVISMFCPFVLSGCSSTQVANQAKFNAAAVLSPFFQSIVNEEKVEELSENEAKRENEIALKMQDGSTTLYTFNEPVKFVDSNGEIKYKDTSIVRQPDSALAEAGYFYANGANDYRINFSKDAKKGIFIRYGGASFTLLPETDVTDLPEGKKVSVERDNEQRDAFEYRNVYGEDSSLFYFPELNGVKDEIVLSKYTGQNEFSFILNTYGCTAELADDGRVQILDSDNQLLQKFAPAFAYDAEGSAYSYDEHYTDGSYKLTELDDHKYRVSIIIPKEFLTAASTVYPVTIDPVTGNLSTSTNAILRSKYPSTSFPLDSCGVGYAAETGKARALVKFSLPSGIKRGATINSAYYYIRELTARTATCYVGVHKVTGSWSSSTTWSNQPAFSSTQLSRRNLNSASTDVSGNPYWYKFDIKSAATDWTHGTTNHGILFKSETETNTTAALWRAFANKDYSTSGMRPYAVINYTNDTAAPTLTSVTGNPTSWTSASVTLTVNGASDGTGAGLHSSPYSFSTTQGVYQWQASKISPVYDKNQTIYVYLRDALGNIALRQTVNIAKIDKTAPEFTVSRNDVSTVTPTSTTLTVNATDVGSGVKEYSFNNGSTWQASNTKTYTQTVNNVTIKVRDNVGNVSSKAMGNIVPPLPNKPIITSITGNPTDWTKQSVTLTVTANSFYTIASYSFDNGSTWQTSNQKTYSSNTSNIIIKVKNTNGDISGPSERVDITKIDKTAPIPPIPYEDGGLIYLVDMGDTQLSNGYSGIDKLEYRVDNGSWTEYTEPFEVSRATDVNVEARAVDRAGNTSDCSQLPVKTTFGKYITSSVDATVQCGGARFDFNRTYDSTTKEWFHSINSTFKPYRYEITDGVSSNEAEAGKLWQLTFVDGQKLIFRETDGSGEYDNDSTGWHISQNDFGYTLVTDDGTSYEYDRMMDSGKLVNISDKNGNNIHFNFDNPYSVVVTDSYGRTYTTYSDFYPIDSISTPMNGTILYDYYTGTRIKNVKDQTSVVTSNYTYDANGLLTRDGDATLTYQNGRIVQETYDNGREVTYSYDTTDHLKVTASDTSGKSSTVIYDNRMNVISETNEEGETTTYLYDNKGNMTASTANEMATSYEYDEKGNVVLVSNADGTTEEYVYPNGESKPIREKDASGQYTYYQYDAEGNILTQAVLKELDPVSPPESYTASSDQSLFDTVKYTYNNRGRVLTKTDSAEGTTVTYSYDSYGNPTQITTSKVIDGSTETSTVTSTYDMLDRELSHTEDGITSTYVYDAAGRTLREAVDGRVTRTLYDTKGRVKQQIGSDKYDAAKDGLNNATPANTYSDASVGNRYTYADNGNLTSETNSNDLVTGYSYDSHGNLLAQTFDQYYFGYTAKGNINVAAFGTTNTTTYDYTDDAKELLKQVNYQNGQKIKYTYTNDGKVQSIGYDTETNPRFTYIYDEFGELSQKTDNHNNTKTVYDGDQVSVYSTQGSDETLLHQYESTEESFTETALGKTHTVKFLENRDQFDLDEGKSLNKGYTKDVDGKTTATQVTLKNGDAQSTVFSTTYSYDKDKMTAVSNTMGSVNENFSYTYDGDGNITAVNHNGQTINYIYDNKQQLVRVNDPNIGRTYLYTYDNRGNITSQKEYNYTTGDVGTQLTQKKYAYEWQSYSSHFDRLTAFNDKPIVYDSTGNRISYNDWTYEWEGGRQLKRMQLGRYMNFEYKYDDNGIRTEKTINGLITKFTTIDGRITSQSNRQDTLYFRYDSAGELFGVQINGEEYLYVKNIQGDVIAMVDDQGNKVVEYKYDAWGNVLSVTGSKANTIGNLNPMRYRGYYYDTETKYYYLQSRYYEPEMGRFINGDEISFILAEKELSKNINLFSYCNNNPIIFADKTGHIAANVVGAVIGAVLGAVGGYFLANWLADKLGLWGWGRNLFVWGMTALIGATAGAIGYFIGPYVAKAWSWLSAKLAGLIRGTYRTIAKIDSFRMRTHINVSKHLWGRVLGRVTETGIKNLIYQAIRKGTWTITSNGVVRILWNYRGKIIEVTGKVINGVFKISDAWVRR